MIHLKLDELDQRIDRRLDELDSRLTAQRSTLADMSDNVAGLREQLESIERPAANQDKVRKLERDSREVFNEVTLIEQRIEELKAIITELSLARSWVNEMKNAVIFRPEKVDYEQLRSDIEETKQQLENIEY